MSKFWTTDGAEVVCLKRKWNTLAFPSSSLLLVGWNVDME